MNIKLIITKKSDSRNVRMFERSIKVFPTTFVSQNIVRQGNEITKINVIENIRSLEIERRGF